MSNYTKSVDTASRGSVVVETMAGSGVLDLTVEDAYYNRVDTELTPDQARKLAWHLFMAADAAEEE